MKCWLHQCTHTVYTHDKHAYTQDAPDIVGSIAAGSKRTRVRAFPAWHDPHGPIARELANGEHPDSVEQRQMQLQGGYGGECVVL